MARCVVILADGLRPDAVTRSDAPNILALSRAYTRAVHAVTVRPSVTVAALASLATGVGPATHGLIEPGLGFLSRLGRLRPLARELKTRRIPTLVAAGVPAARSRPVAWALSACAGIDRLLTRNAAASAIARLAAPHILREPSSFAFVYLPDCDRAGHAHGWMTPRYREAVREVDAAVGVLVGTGLLEDSLLAILADHGGGGVAPTDHDAPHWLNDRIPLVLAGRGVRRHTITRDVSLLDVPPTVLAWFGVPVPESYEGRPLAEAFVTTETAPRREPEAALA